MTGTEQIRQISGSWRNQLGSELYLETDGHGRLHGKFRNSAGSGAGKWLPVVGSYDPSPEQGSTVLAFVVDWTEVHCVTAWSGQYRPEFETMSATWIMTTEREAPDEWRATTVGHDLFRRLEDTVDLVP